MRCEIGWPIVTFMPGSVENPRRSVGQQLFARPLVSRRPTSISAASTPCTCSSSSARPVRRAVATTSGCASRICSTRRPISSDFASDVPGSVFAWTVSVPSWNSGRNAVPIRVIANAAPASSTSGRRDDQTRAIERERQHPREASLERPRQPAVVPALDRTGVRQERVAQRRRHDDRDDQRREQRHDVGEGQRRQQPPLDAGQDEERQEHEHDDERREDDRPADLERGVADDLGDRALLLRRLRRFSRRRRTTFSTSMIASSTSAPMAMAMPPSVMVLIDGAEGAQHEHGRGERQRNRRQRDGGGAQVRQEDQHDDDDEDAAVAQRLDDVVDRDLDEVRLAEDLAVDLIPAGSSAESRRARGRACAVSSIVFAPGCF